MSRSTNTDAAATLHSWKEIAVYLSVSARTAQSWEKDHGLPVHRLPGGPKAGVFAYKSEIDLWRSQRSKQQETHPPADRVLDAPPLPVEPPAAPREPVADISPAPGGGHARRRWLIASSALLLLLAAISYGAVTILRPTRSLEPATAEMKGRILLVMNNRAQVLWSRAFPQADLSLFANETFYQPIIIEDIDSDGETEVLYNYRPGHAQFPGDSKLVCFARDGSVRWEFVYGREKTWGKTRKLPSLYGGSILRRIRDGKRSWIMALAIQTPYFPCQVAFLDPRTGQPVWEYWHPGHLTSCLLHDLDRDGQDEIILGGINNPGPGIGHAALVALKSPSADTVPNPGQWQSPDWWGGNEYKYVLFPRPHIAEELAGGSAVGDIFVPVAGQLGVSLRGGDMDENQHICWTGIYKLDFDLNPLSFRPHDCFVSTHDLFFKRGRTDHRLTDDEVDALRRVAHFSTTPNGNDPALASLLAPAPRPRHRAAPAILSARK